MLEIEEEKYDDDKEGVEGNGLLDEELDEEHHRIFKRSKFHQYAQANKQMDTLGKAQKRKVSPERGLKEKSKSLVNKEGT